MRVHFICRGNAYRSRLSQGYFDSLNTGIETLSSGTVADDNRAKNHPNVTGYALNFLKKHGIDAKLSPEPVQLTQDILDKDDVVVCINQRVLDEMKGYQLSKNVRVWDIADFDEQSERADIDDHTEHIFAQIKQNADALAAELTK